MFRYLAALTAVSAALCLPVFAQSHRAPLLTATASGTSVRYAGFGEVRELRLQIFDDRGQVLFSSSFTSGNLFDYSMVDDAGAPLNDGAYLFVVTIHDFAGGSSEKFGMFTISGSRVMLENAPADALSPGSRPPCAAVC